MKIDNESIATPESTHNSETSAVDHQSEVNNQSKNDPPAVSGGQDLSPRNFLDRRAFLNRTAFAGLFAGGLLAAPGLFGRMGKVLAQQPGRCPSACELVPYTDGVVRADLAKQRRINAAIYERNMDIPLHPCNEDEQLYSRQNYFASYTKGLKRADGVAGDYYGEVDSAVYCTLLRALESGIPADFEDVLLGFANTCSGVQIGRAHV